MAMNPQFDKPPRGGAMSYEDYLELERSQPYKYEYLNGVARLMAGGSREHSAISINLVSTLKQQFLTGPCHVANSDMKVLIGVKPNGSEYCVYPDATISCNIDDRRRGNRLVRSPRVVFEVLSPSNEAHDRGEKLQAYKDSPTVEEIVLVNQFAQHVEVYTCDDEEGKVWSKREYGPKEIVDLLSIDVQIGMDEIYEGIDFNEPLWEDEF